MTVFAVIAPEANPALNTAIKRDFPRHLEFAAGQFVVAADGLTAAQVFDKIDPKSELGFVVVFTVGGFWGFHRKDLWEWLRANPI